MAASTEADDSTRRGLPLLLLLPLVLAPLPLACVRETPRALLTACLAAAVAVVAWRAAQGRILIRVPAGTLFFGAFIGIALIQLVPFAGPVSMRGEGVLGGIVPTTLSLVAARTLPRIGEGLALLGLFVVSGAVFARRVTARLLCVVLVGLGAALSLYGFLAQHGIFALQDASQTATVTVATYVNRNHLAGLLECALLAGVGLLASARGSTFGTATKAWLVGGLAACTLGLIATESRGGLIAFGFGLLVLCALRRTVRPAHLALLLAGAVLVTLVLPSGLAARFLRVGDELGAQGTRPDIWLGGVRLALAFPWLGTGLGTYGDLSPATQPPAVHGRIEHAHCDPLEVLAETGVTGLALLATAVVIYLHRVVVRVRATQDRERAWLGAGLFAGVAALLLHGLVDFNLQIPANAAWCAAIAGAASGLVAAHSKAPMPRSLHLVIALGCTLVTGFGVTRAFTHDDSDGTTARARAASALATDPHAAVEFAESAIAKNAFSASAWRLAGSGRLRSGTGTAQTAFDRAIEWTNPHERPALRVGIATEYLAAGDPDAARRFLHELLLEGAEQRQAAWKLLYAAVPAHEVLRTLTPPVPKVRAELAAFLLGKGEFQGRELELAALRGPGLEPALLTIAPNLFLERCTLRETLTEDAKLLAVDLAFCAGPKSTPCALVLRLDGRTAGLYRSFSSAGEPYRWEFRIDRTFPPGRYDVGLDFGANAPHFPLGSTTIAESLQQLPASGRLPADRDLYWSTENKGLRQRGPLGIPLAKGDVLWRRVCVPSDGVALRIDGCAVDALSLSFAGRELAMETASRCFVLESAEAGLLEIRRKPKMSFADGADGAPCVLALIVAPRGDR